MKKIRFLVTILWFVFISGCSFQQPDNSYTTIQPYELSKKESVILQSLPFTQEQVSFYEVTVPNKQDEIRTVIEHYQHGERVQDIVALSSSNFEDKKIKLSVGQQIFQHENTTRETWRWFISIDGHFMTTSEDSPPHVTGSAYKKLHSTKKIKYNEKAFLAAWVKTNNNKISVISLEDKEILQRLIQENEHVYLYSIEIQNRDAP